jgi:hypothetical protein
MFLTWKECPPTLEHHSLSHFILHRWHSVTFSGHFQSAILRFGTCITTYTSISFHTHHHKDNCCFETFHIGLSTPVLTNHCNSGSCSWDSGRPLGQREEMLAGEKSTENTHIPYSYTKQTTCQRERTLNYWRKTRRRDKDEQALHQPMQLIPYDT